MILLHLIKIYTEVIKLEDNMIDFTNFLRKHSNMEILKRNKALDKVAIEQVKYMCKTKKLTHASRNLLSIKERLRHKGFNASVAGENIAKQHSYTKKNKQQYTEVAKMWFKSKEHRKNILGDFTYTAVASCETDKEKYWIQVFAKEKKDWFDKEPEKSVRQHRKKKPFNYGEINEAERSCTVYEECETGELLRPRTFYDVDEGIKTKTVTVSKEDKAFREQICRMMSSSVKTKTVTVSAQEKRQREKSTARNDHSQMIQTTTFTTTQTVTSTPTTTSSSATSSSQSSSTTTLPSSQSSSAISSTQPSSSTQPPPSSALRNDLFKIIPELAEQLKDELLKDVTDQTDGDLFDQIKKEYSDKNIDQDMLHKIIKEVVNEMNPAIEIA